jgi:hypothetical protein
MRDGPAPRSLLDDPDSKFLLDDPAGVSEGALEFWPDCSAAIIREDVVDRVMRTGVGAGT